ncbi:MAG: Sterol 3-beta-glucosyltransferase [Chrysothrix sp. TS-e1954]|nr:MAG: Sterol 3-beta-glucosyltransferase [Chrysothrix sp. TS-e1954]
MASQSVMVARRDTIDAQERTRFTRRASLVFPERFMDGDDAQDDVTAPRTKKGQLVNQSFVSMIANVGSNASFNPTFDLPNYPNTTSPKPSSGLVNQSSRSRLRNRHPHRVTDPRNVVATSESERTMFRSTPTLKKPSRRQRNLTSMAEDMSTSQILEPLHVEPGKNLTSEAAPVSDEEMSLDDSGNNERPATGLADSAQTPDTQQASAQPDVTAGSALNEKVASVFGFDEVEKVVSDYSCGLLQNILLQGHMYVTLKHLCFYAYLPSTSRITKSGYLFKKGRKNPATRRFWFTLRGHVLSYHANPSNLYFVNGIIDLRTAHSVTYENVGVAAKSCAFTIQTSDRQYQLKAESEASAREWVKHLEKIILRSQYRRDSVKISLPIDNILDVENNPVLNFTDTLRVRVVDNDETFAIDEPLVEQNVVNKEQARHSPFVSSPSDTESSDQSSSSKHRTLSKQDTKDSVLNAISQSVMIDAAPSFVHRGKGDGQYRQRRGYIGDIPKADPAILQSSTAKPLEDDDRQHSEEKVARRKDSRETTRRLQNNDENTTNDDTGSSDGDHFRDPTLSASQILLSSGLFNRSSPTRYPTRKMSDTQSSSSKPYSVSREGTQTDTSSADFGPRQSNPSSEEHGENILNIPQPTTQRQIQQSSSSSTLQDLMRRGTYPLQKATGIAGLIRTQSRRVSDLLAIESKGYLGKVSGMWSGRKTHYDDTEALASDDADDGKHVEDGDRFRMHFSLPQHERLSAAYHAWLHRTVPVYGKLYIGERKLCFRGLVMGQRTKARIMILPFRDIENVDNENGFRFGYSGLVVVVRGHEELFFEFARPDTRNDCTNTLLRGMDTAKDLQQTSVLSHREKSQAEIARAEKDSLDHARREGFKSHEDVNEACINEPSSPILFDGPLASIVEFKPPQPLNITCLTIGSRGDVQPYLALCRGLLEEGHRPRIVTHAEFEPWIRHHGIDFAPVAGDPAEIMRLCVEHDMFTVSFFREATSKFRGWIDQLLKSAWKACQGADVLIESPSAMAGIHIAEALRIPYFRAFTMPWTRTRAYPHAFAVPSQKLGGNYNTFSYVMFDNVFWQATAGQINRWRASTLGLPATNLDRLQASKVPFLYNYSPSVVPPPMDFNQWIRVTGYWFLDEGNEYTPPMELSDFIQKARTDGKKIVYVGFGSIVVDDPAALTRTVVDSILRADVRCILSKGWSDRLELHKDSSKPEFPLPPEIFQIRSAPHDWLFQQIDAAAHHGGAGTTGASLRAGIPTIVKPFFGDQFFFGSRIEDLGVGRCLKKINTSVFARTLWEVTNSQRIIDKAKKLGEQIRSENGVGTAIQALYRDLEYARTLIKQHPNKAALSHTDDEATEDWTLVGENTDDDDDSNA